MSTKEIIGIAAVILLFIVATLVANQYAEALRAWLDIGPTGIAIYMLLGFLATVVAPISTLPLLPVAVVLWGPLTAALASIVGWFAGALVAFYIARRWGKPLVEKFVNLERVKRYEHILGVRYVFWNLVFLRMAVPVDVLSYAIGLFTTVSWRVYTAATLIGIMPFAFIFSYTSAAPLYFRIGVLALAGFAVLLGYRRVRRKLS